MQSKPTLLILTGPQGSGNHLFSKIFSYHKDVYGWSQLYDKEWVGHDQEVFQPYWLEPRRLKEFDWTQSQYYVTSIRLIFTVLIISSIAGAGFYVMKLRSDNAILKANQIELEKSIEKQTQLLEKQKIDFEAILESNKKLNVLINTLKKDMDELDKRSSKG